jgi:MraZ protein
MRDELGPQVVVSKGIDRCLHVFPIKEWERQVERVRSLATTNRNARNYARFFFSQAAPAEVDKQGRLTVPQAFRDYAGLDREVVVAGNGDRVEIWDAARWSQHVTEVESGIEDFASELGI